jgi:hypothetical protein
MDTHTGNFLYAKNSEHNPEGYYQYSFGDDETYYLKSCIYNVMIHDFEHSNKIDIPIEEIKRFELFYKIEEEEAKISIIRDYVVKHKQYTNIKINAPISVDERDYLNKIKDKFVDIEFYVNYYRIKILIDDYGIFLQDLRVLFEEDEDVVENTGRLNTIDTIKDKIEKIKGDYDYLKKQPTITDAQFYGYAKDIFKRVLDICIDKFPNIFSKKETKSMFPTLFGRPSPQPSQQPTPQTILNNQPYLLYQPTKITVEEPTITQ